MTLKWSLLWIEISKNQNQMWQVPLKPKRKQSGYKEGKRKDVWIHWQIVDNQRRCTCLFIFLWERPCTQHQRAHDATREWPFCDKSGRRRLHRRPYIRSTFHWFSLWFVCTSAYAKIEAKYIISIPFEGAYEELPTFSKFSYKKPNEVIIFLGRKHS